MRHGSGYTFADGNVQETISAKCGLCGRRYARATSHDTVIYGMTDNLILLGLLGLLDKGMIKSMPDGHTTCVCSKQCFDDAMVRKEKHDR